MKTEILLRKRMSQISGLRVRASLLPFEEMSFKYDILGCSKSFESDIYRAVEEPKFLRHFKISSFI